MTYFDSNGNFKISIVRGTIHNGGSDLNDAAGSILNVSILN